MAKRGGRATRSFARQPVPDGGIRPGTFATRVSVETADKDTTGASTEALDRQLYQRVSRVAREFLDSRRPRPPGSRTRPRAFPTTQPAGSYTGENTAPEQRSGSWPMRVARQADRIVFRPRSMGLGTTDMKKMRSNTGLDLTNPDAAQSVAGAPLCLLSGLAAQAHVGLSPDHLRLHLNRKRE